MSAVIEAKELGRWYGEVVGLNELTVSIEPGVTGLVGPNGAGKSTFMKLMVGEIRPSRGSIRMIGRRRHFQCLAELFQGILTHVLTDELKFHSSSLAK